MSQDIDFLTATPREVIARSMLMHPALFAEVMRSMARLHGTYAANTHSSEAARIANDCQSACACVAHLIDENSIDGIMLHISRWVPALDTALKLQIVPRSVWADIAARGEA